MPRTLSRVAAGLSDQPVKSVLYADHPPAMPDDGALTTPRMTAFRPGQSPPPVRMPMVRFTARDSAWRSRLPTPALFGGDGQLAETGFLGQVHQGDHPAMPGLTIGQQ